MKRLSCVTNHHTKAENLGLLPCPENPGFYRGNIASLDVCRPFFGEDGLFLGAVPEGFSCRGIFFDMDATFVAEETLVEVAHLCGRGEELDRMTADAMEGRIGFEESLRARVALLKGQPASLMDRVAEKLTVNPGIESLLRVCVEKSIPAFLISGGFIPLAARLARQYGLRDFHANRLEEQDGLLTGGVVGEIVGSDGKRDWLLKICKEHGISLADTMAIGDGANDLGILQAVQVAVGYRCKPVLYPHISVYNGDGDHSMVSVFL